MKKILVTIVVLILLAVAALAVLVFISPTEFKVQRDVVVNKPKAEVFEYLKLLKNQNEWGAWVKKDPNIKLTYSGTDGEVGFVSKWEGTEEVGAGEQEIKKIDEGNRIDYELRFKKPFESTADAYIITEDADSGKTKVTWGFSGEMPRPMNLMLLLMDMDAEVGKDFEEGLASLKSIVEKRESPKTDNEDEEAEGESKTESGDEK